MADSNSGLGAPRWVARAVLGGLGAVQFVNGIWATLAPRSFYGEFPFGRGWVEALPAYNDHLMRDVGGLFMATGFLLLAAAWFFGRRLVAIALVAYLLFSVPHAVYHLLNLGPYETVDAIGNVATLAVTVLAPAALLIAIGRASPAPELRPGAIAPAGSAAAAPRPGDSAAPPGGAAATANGNGRIAGVPENTRRPLVRLAYRYSRRRFGAVMDPIRLYAHHRTVMTGYALHELAAERADRVPERLKHLAVLRAGMVAGCEWCCDFGSALSAASDVSVDDMRALVDHRRSDRFSELELLVLDYATGMSRTPIDVSDELFDRLREHLDEAQLVELTDIVALENYRARFNWALGLEGQGFSEGTFCVRPEEGAASAAPDA